MYISLENLQPYSKEASALYQLLASSHQFLFRQKNKKTPIVLSNILLRNTKSNKPYTSFYVREQMLGDGGNGEVHALMGKIILLDKAKTCIYIPGTKYVMKESRMDGMQDVSSERSNLEKLNLGGQLLAELMSSEAFLMKRIKGLDVVEYYKDNAFDAVEARAVCRAMIDAYKKQVLEKGLIHRDIKADNIILHYHSRTKAYEATFIDFDLAIALDNERAAVEAERVGCVWNLDIQSRYYGWMASYSRAVDLWALNIMLLNIMGMENPIEDFRDHDYQAINYVADGLLDRDIEHCSFFTDDVKRVMRKALSFKPEDRYTFEALEAEWEKISPLMQHTPQHSHQAERVDALQAIMKKMKSDYYGDFQTLAGQRYAKLDRLVNESQLTRSIMRKQKAWVDALGLFAKKPSENKPAAEPHSLVNKT